MSTTALSIPTNYVDNNDLTQAILDKAFSAIEQWAVRTNNNLEQLGSDMFGEGLYNLNNLGYATATNSLFQKQNATTTYDSGNEAINDSSGAYKNITNATITFTPQQKGDYRVTFQFVFNPVASGASVDAEYRFRLTDGTNFGNATAVQWQLAGSGAADSMYIPITLTHIFSDLSASSKSINLQYAGMTRSNLTTTQLLADSNVPIVMSYEKV